MFFLNCLYNNLGLQFEHSNAQDDQTILIDFEKYQQLLRSHRHPRNANALNKTDSNICSDLQTEEYKKCGNHCILGCSHDRLTSGLIVSKDDCNATKCVEGCFCKDGLVRHQNKCIPAKECPGRRSKAVEFIADNFSPFFKHLGIFSKPMQSSSSGSTQCGLFLCNPPQTIEIHNHNEATTGKFPHECLKK